MSNNCNNKTIDGYETAENLILAGTLQLEDGSATQPSLTFADDLNTGVFSSAQETVNITTAGVQRLLISNTQATLAEPLSVDDTTDTSSATTGSIHTDGGIGCAKKLYMGDAILGASGTNALPSVSVRSSDLGMYSSGINILDFATAGVQRLSLSSSGLVVTPQLQATNTGLIYKNIHLASISNTTTQSINNSTETLLTFDTEDYDNQGSIANTTNNRLDIQRAGKYIIIAKSSVAVNSGGDRRYIAIYQNAVRKNIQSWSDLNGVGDVRMFSVILLNCAVNDTITLYGFQDSGGALNFGGTSQNQTILSCVYVSD